MWSPTCPVHGVNSALDASSDCIVFWATGLFCAHEKTPCRDDTGFVIFTLFAMTD